jgi:pyruvate formate lyase activating enzyme
VFSLGTIGCNFKCDHCQNYGISTAVLDYKYMREINPEQAIELAKKQDCQGIAWTYNEPTIWHEYTFDTSKLAKKNDLYTVYVSNGYIGEDPLREISPYLDAMNVDVKAFNDGFYKKICKARLQPVLKTCELVKELGIHLELTYLIIPTLNDSSDEITSFCKWVVEKLGNTVPVHFSRFHPDYKMTNFSFTPMETMMKAYDIAKKMGVLFPYLGNVPSGDYENTVCPNCGYVCISRQGYLINLNLNKGNKCKQCGKDIQITN